MMDRLVRDIAQRLGVLPESERALVTQILEEALEREQRYHDRELTVEGERERREEAEGLREATEAVSRSIRLDETADEVLRQADRLAPATIAEIALATPEGRFRVVGLREGDDFSAAPGRFLPAALALVLANRKWCGTAQDGGPSCDPGGLVAGLPSWCALPLIVEGDVVGGLVLGSTQHGAFGDAALHRLRALAFSASAALQRAQRHEQVRLFAALLEQVILVQQKAFAATDPGEVARALLDGALLLGHHPAGLLILEVDGEARIVAVSGVGADLELEGRPAPAGLHAQTSRRLEGEALAPIVRELSLPIDSTSLYLVPVVAGGSHVGTLVIADPDGETPDDRLMEAYTSRAGLAYQFALDRKR